MLSRAGTVWKLFNCPLARTVGFKRSSQLSYSPIIYYLYCIKFIGLSQYAESRLALYGNYLTVR